MTLQLKRVILIIIDAFFFCQNKIEFRDSSFYQNDISYEVKRKRIDFNFDYIHEMICIFLLHK